MPYSKTNNTSISILMLIIMVAFVASCGDSRNSAQHQNNDGHRYDTVFMPKYASKFELLYDIDDSVNVLIVKNPWQGAQQKTYSYKLSKPFQRVVCMSSSYIAYLDAVLDSMDQIVGVSGATYMTNREVAERAVDVGYEQNINYEALVALRPDVVFMYEVSGENSSIVKKMRSLGLNVIYVADYLEELPLGKAEWLVAFGAMMGVKDRGVEAFENIESSYQDMVRRVDSLLIDSSVVRPRVMLNSPYRDVWYAPGDRSYMVRLLRDAGAEYVASGVDSDASRPIALEVAYKYMLSSDYWLNPGMVVDMQELKSANPKFSNLDLVTNRKVYNNNLRITPGGGSDFWESGAARPDLVLKDLVKIVHPELAGDHEFYYYRQLQ